MQNYYEPVDWEAPLHAGIKRRNLMQGTRQPYLFNRLILVKDYLYVAHATHPDQPNWSGNSRGRTTHYCLVPKKGTKTLCNMLVSEVHSETIDVRTDDHFSGMNYQAGCKVCTDKAGKVIKQIIRGEI